MGSDSRCAPRSGRCEGHQGVVCARVCLAEASVGLIGGCVRSCRLGGARRHPPPRAHGGSCRWLGLLCRAKRLLTRRLGVCSQVAIRKAEWSVGCYVGPRSAMTVSRIVLAQLYKYSSNSGTACSGLPRLRPTWNFECVAFGD